MLSAFLTRRSNRRKACSTVGSLHLQGRVFEALEVRSLLSAMPAAETAVCLAEDSIPVAAAPASESGGEAGTMGSVSQGPITQPIVTNGIGISTETVVINSDPLNPVQGFFDVFLEAPTNRSFRAAGYEVSLSLEGNPFGIRLTGVQPSSFAHPPLFGNQNPTVFSTGTTLSVTDFLNNGDVLVEDGAGLFRVGYTVDPGVTGSFRVAFNTDFTNVADRNANTLFLEALTPGEIRVLNTGALSISIDDVSISEGNAGNRQANFNVTLTRTTTNTVSVNYATAGVSATPGVDFLSTSGRLTFAPGETTKQISVPIIGDTQLEVNETFAVTLSNPAGATILRSQATGTIVNDDTSGGQQHPWQNATNPVDTNNDGQLTALDALVVINDLNAFGARALPIPPVAPNQPPPFVDVNGDDQVSAVDALIVINALNELSSGGASPAPLAAEEVASEPVAPAPPIAEAARGLAIARMLEKSRSLSDVLDEDDDEELPWE